MSGYDRMCHLENRRRNTPGQNRRAGFSFPPEAVSAGISSRIGSHTLGSTPKPSCKTEDRSAGCPLRSSPCVPVQPAARHFFLTQSPQRRLRQTFLFSHTHYSPRRQIALRFHGGNRAVPPLRLRSCSRPLTRISPAANTPGDRCTHILIGFDIALFQRSFPSSSPELGSNPTKTKRPITRQSHPL